MPIIGVDRRRGVDAREVRDPVLKARAEAFVTRYGGIVRWQDAIVTRNTTVTWTSPMGYDISITAPSGADALHQLDEIALDQLAPLPDVLPS
jgi:hypothetical protein